MTRPAESKAFLADGFGLGFAWIDLVNSEHRDGFGRVTEHLDDPAWIGGFLRFYGLDGAIDRLPGSELGTVRAFLRAAAETIAAGHHLGRRRIADANRAIGMPVRRVLHETAEGYALTLVPTRRGRSWLEAEFMASFADCLAHHQTRRLKICPNPGCRWLFYDRTNGNTRRWCNDKTCGNRDKVRRLRRRRAAASPS